MANKPIATAKPPELADDKKPVSALLDPSRFTDGMKHTWIQWPRLFDHFYRKYKVPPSCMDTVRALWSECLAGYNRDRRWGRVALSQIPVETHTAQKWLAALESSGLFTCIDKSGPGDQEGSQYQYNAEDPETIGRTWECFFLMAAAVVGGSGLDRDVSVAEFGQHFAWIQGDELTGFAVRVVSGNLMAEQLRPRKKRGLRGA